MPYATKTADDRLERVAVRGLRYQYPDTQRGISDISFTLNRGTLTVVTGRVGSGKTTLLRVLLGLLPKDAGEVRWNDRLIDDLASDLVPPRSAYTAQVPRLFSEPLHHNILMGLPEHATDLPAALHQAVLAPDVAGFESGLDTVVGPRGARLSGGQIQRTAAARMFARQPELLVCDDLSSALDVQTERTLWERLDENRRTKNRRTDEPDDEKPTNQQTTDQLTTRSPRFARSPVWRSLTGGRFCAGPIRSLC